MAFYEGIVIISLLVKKVPGHQGHKLLPPHESLGWRVDLSQDFEDWGVIGESQHLADEGSDFLDEVRSTREESFPSLSRS